MTWQTKHVPVSNVNFVTWGISQIHTAVNVDTRTDLQGSKSNVRLDGFLVVLQNFSHTFLVKVFQPFEQKTKILFCNFKMIQIWHITFLLELQTRFKWHLLLLSWVHKICKIQQAGDAVLVKIKINLVFAGGQVMKLLLFTYNLSTRK